MILLLVCMVAERYPPHIGGAPFCIHQLSSALVRLGHHVHVVTGSEPETPREEVIDGVQVFRVGRSGVPRLRSLTFVHEATRKLFNLSKEHGYDLVHCHNGVGGLIGYRWRRAFEKPYIVTLHGSIATSMKAGYLVRTLARLIEEFSVKNADAATFDGRSLLTDFLASTGMERRKAFYIPNAVDPEVFSPQSDAKSNVGINPDSTNVTYVGRLVPGKGLLTLLDAFSQAWSNMSGLSLIIVGDGPYLRVMEEDLRRRNPNPSVSFLGAISHNELPRIYAASHMVVLPSISEGLSRSLLEAMACEKPVIATGIPANLSLVQDGENGLIVPLGSTELLAEAILRLAKDKNLQRRLGRAARKTILREYVVDKRVERMLDAYRVALESFQDGKRAASLRGGFSQGE